MRKSVLIAFGLAVVGCQAQPATSAALQELSFSQPCSSLSDFFASKNVNMRGDPLGPGQKASIFMEDSVFRVVEIGCTRIKSEDGKDSEPMPVTITFYSGGTDEQDRLTNASLRLDEKLIQSYGDPSKKFQTGRWESSQWLVGVTRVRHFESTPSDTRDLRVEFSLYPTNDVKALDESLDKFLQILAKEPLAPPVSNAQ
jgi:hypothetical protein